MKPIVIRLFFIIVLVFGQVQTARALAPANDHFAAAEAIAGLPFSTTADLSEATLETGEPQTCEPSDRTAWYSFVPSTTTVLIADARTDHPPKISIYRAAGAGVSNLELVQCVSPGGGITFLAEQGETYYIQVGPVAGAPGTVQFHLSEVIDITGRLIDAASGAPLSGAPPTLANATLLRVCGDGCLEFVRAVAASEDGSFRMDFYFGEDLSPGTYMIEAAAGGYQTRQFGPYEFTGADLDVGTLPLDPLPIIGSIRGRLVDHLTGRPVPQEFAPVVELYRCFEGHCVEFMGSLVPDAQGRFRFETDGSGVPLIAGTYLVVAYADQYHLIQSQLLEVGEGEHPNTGNLRLRSFPVRLSDVVPCPDLPASGGECEYSVRIWNGMGGRLEGAAWSLAAGLIPNSLAEYTEFQPRAPVEIDLERGKSRVVRFRFHVPPADGPELTGICTRIFVGRGGNPFFNTIGFRDLFCVLRNGEGFAAAPPRAATPPAGKVLAVDRLAIEAEPNNSCQEAQDLGAPALPFSMDGNLDSSQAPDIDYYRVSGSPGAPLVIDLEGAATGSGTLPDPLLGAFDSGCNLLAVNDDSGSLNSRLALGVPGDGVVILAATAFPDFDFLGGGHGTYRLTLSTYTPIGSITGTVIDATTGAPLPGDVLPFASAYLQQCGDFGCFDVAWQPTAGDGSFRFETDFNGAPLGAGTYVVVAGAEQHRFTFGVPFTIGEGEHVDVGVLALTGFPVQFSEIQGCSIPAEGGTCRFSARVTNTTSARISGKAWSIVGGFDLGTFAGFTTFQTDTAQEIRLDPGESETLHFRFRVREAVTDGAIICPNAHAGQNPSAFLHPVGLAFLFCLVKGDGGFALMAPDEAQKAWHKMQQPAALQSISEKRK